MFKCKKCKNVKNTEDYLCDTRYANKIYPYCKNCLDDNYSDFNTSKSKECTSCKEIKPLLEFKKKYKSPTGFEGKCKSCNKEVNNKRNKKLGLVSVKETEIFLQRLRDSGEKFQCKCCDKVDTVDSFYYKRDYGKVYISTTRCKDCEKVYKLKDYGIDQKYFENLMKDQQNSCAICKTHIEEYSSKGHRKHFAVDHCHTTGNVRGLLCDMCNRGLGFFKDDISILTRAITYLKDT